MEYYRLTPLEQSVEETYRGLGITEPEHLTIANVASKLRIWVYYLDMPSRVVESRGMYSMNIDRRLTREEMWEDFLHELCHVLRHAGNQTAMPELMLDMQEAQAAQFQLYAGLPYSMVRRLSLPDHQGEAAMLLSREFGVTKQLAQRRLEQIQRRILQGAMDEETLRYLRQPKQPRAAWSEETVRLMDQLKHQTERRNEYGSH